MVTHVFTKTGQTADAAGSYRKYTISGYINAVINNKSILKRFDEHPPSAILMCPRICMITADRVGDEKSKNNGSSKRILSGFCR